MADFVLYAIILVIAFIITKYTVPFILSTTEIPHNLVSIVNLTLHIAIFCLVFLTFYFLPQPRGLVYQIITKPTTIAAVTPIATPFEPLTPKPGEPTWTPTGTPPPAPTWTPTGTPPPAPTWTPTNIPPTRKPNQPTHTPSPTSTKRPTTTPRDNKKSDLPQLVSETVYLISATFKVLPVAF
jgi:hypothetical protein